MQKKRITIKSGTITLMLNGKPERIVTYHSYSHRQQIIEQWQKETRHILHMNRIDYIIEPRIETYAA